MEYLKHNSLEITNYLAYTLFYLLIIQVIYFQFLSDTIIQNYWIITPLLLYVLSIYMAKLKKSKEPQSMFFSIVCLMSLILSFLFLKLNGIKIMLYQYFDTITFFIIAIFLLNIIIRDLKQDEVGEELDESGNNLFNLFYINTPKVHEIAMLIDNKVMKTIEKEQVSEELLRQDNTFSVGNMGNRNAELGYSKEESTKKKVYESFDVKTTKSIMLKKIYEYVKNSSGEQKELKLGDLVIFEDIELQQRNVEDTVMILNVLRDSKIKSNPDEDLEVNLNKMMDRMLDDFTIDYTFSDVKGERYLLQVPYKDTDNFENGYQHNDLQLGELSLIGVYRGEIDFSEKDSISSEFLELMSKSYQNELQQNMSTTMNKSSSSVEPPSLLIDFKYKKLEEKLNLIDVIAVIQDLKINRGE